MAGKNYNTEDINGLLDEFSSGEGENIDQIIRDVRRELERDVPQYPETNSDSPVTEPGEFRDQEYLETFGDRPLPIYDTEPNRPPRREELQQMPPEQPRQQEAVPDRSKKGKKKKKPKRRGSAVLGLFSTVIYIAVVAAIAILLAKFIWLCADDVLALTKEDQIVHVTIKENATLDDITNELYDKGLIHYPWLFKIYGGYAHAENKVDAGVYELNTLFDYHALLNAMSGYAARETVTVTTIEGWSCQQIFAQLEEAGVCEASDLEQAAAEYAFDYDFLQDVPYGEPNRLEGYLYPDTYEFYKSEDADSVIKRFLDNFENRVDDEVMEQINDSGYTLREILTIASMIEEEAASEDERADISSVIYNRLGSDELPYLQMDSTVFYAASLMGRTFDTQLDNPYNTYRYAGLPAGPIDNPGMKAILAALNPNETNYMYFAYGTDGVSHFYSDFDSFSAFLNSDEYAG